MNTPKIGVGATSSSSGAVPAIIAGGAILLGLAAVIALATADRKKTVEQEALDLFPPPHGRGSTPGRKILAFKQASARCFYRELRREHPADVAADVAMHAVARDRGWLGGLARAGAPVSAGCAQLRSHAPTIYRA